MVKLTSQRGTTENYGGEIDTSVPPSERGKGENMPLDNRSPSSVFGIVGLTYPLVLFLFAIGFFLWIYSR